MKNCNRLLLFVFLLTSCSNADMNVDGIQYENLMFSDSVVLINGQKKFLDIDVDYPIGNSIEATNIRKYIMFEITSWHFPKQHESILSNENLIDSLCLWSRLDTIDKKSERLIKINAVTSGIEGIATLEWSFNPYDCTEFFSTYVKTGNKFRLPIDSLIIYKVCYEISRQKDAIEESPFFEDNWWMDVPPPTKAIFANSFVKDSMVSLYYNCDSLNNPFYISIPFSEIKDRLPDWK